LSPRVTIITPVALDHAEFLGETLEKVAREKAGIIKKDTPVVVAPQRAEAMRVIRKRAGEMNAPLHAAGEDFSFSVKGSGAGGLTFDYCASGGLALEALEVPLLGDYQALNASLAVRAFELIAGDAGEGAVREGLKGMRPPGRLELLRREPPVYLDGAHNPEAAEALARAIEGRMRPVMVIGIMGDKDVEKILAPLLPLADGAIFAAPAYGRSATAEALLRSARALGYGGEAAPTVREALEAALARGKPVLVTGSFFTIGEAKEALLGASPSRVAKLGEWQAAP
ncbi:MAG: cyanophycin synthetase, partial [Nitrospirota bacterium]